MKKVIKPSKQPTKKQSQRSQRNTDTAKLKKAIGKIAAQLVKDHPKLVKGGGSSGITDLIFSKNLMKGGEINGELRDSIVKFLKDSAPKVNKLKKDLLIKLIRDIKEEKGSAQSMRSLKIIYEMFKDNVYNYEELFKDEGPIYNFYNEESGRGRAKIVITDDVQEDYTILDIVYKFYKLSNITDEEANIINETKFENFSADIVSAIDRKDNTKLLEAYEKLEESKKKDDDVEQEKNISLSESDETKLSPYTAKELFSDITETETMDSLQIDRTELLQDGKELLIAGPKVSTDRTPGNDATLLRTKLTAVSEAEPNKVRSYGDRSGQSELPALQSLPAEPKKVRSYGDRSGQSALPAVPDDDARRYKDTSGQSSLLKKGSSDGGGLPPKYKSTGQVVNIMYKKRKYKRTIFVKEKRKTKYCKINNEYILLSKLNVM